MKHLKIVIPVFNDWTSFFMLLRELDRVFADRRHIVSVLAVDDGSTDDAPTTLEEAGAIPAVSGVRVAKLAMNLGHQRAIAVGLSMASEEPDVDAVVIMDADGEDRPQDVPCLIAAADGKRDFVVVAERRKRSERLSFKLFYALYRGIFAILTGRNMSFGNFSLISRQYVRRLTMTPDLWNNLPAALIHSRLPIQRLPTDRGHRYHGTPKMNYISLMVLGLSGISVYSDAIFVRMLIATGCLLVTSVIAGGVVAAIRLFTDLATPGWATTVEFGIIIIVFQAVVSTLTALLLLLSSRSQRSIVPALDYGRFVDSCTELTPVSLTASAVA